MVVHVGRGCGGRPGMAWAWAGRGGRGRKRQDGTQGGNKGGQEVRAEAREQERRYLRGQYQEGEAGQLVDAQGYRGGKRHP